LEEIFSRHHYKITSTKQFACSNFAKLNEIFNPVILFPSCVQIFADFMITSTSEVSGLESVCSPSTITMSGSSTKAGISSSSTSSGTFAKFLIGFLTRGMFYIAEKKVFVKKELNVQILELSANNSGKQFDQQELFITTEIQQK
jgi:hypothetical protein